MAHEETHILHYINKIELLEQKMREHFPDFSFNGLSDYKKCSREGREFVASMGGLYALHKDGVNIKDITYECPQMYIRAFQTFKDML